MKIDKYMPLYFLSSLGAGGLSVSFFMAFMFLIPHKNTPLPIFETILPYAIGEHGILISLSTIFIILGIIFFSFQHFKLLIWNFKEYNKFKNNGDINSILGTNNQISLMTIPLTLAMTVNVAFILGAVFVPGLWGVVEYLFPFALLAFLTIGFMAIKLFLQYFNEVLLQNKFNIEANNNFGQLISVFAFTMLAVGFAAPGAMSHNIIINSIGLFFCLFFLTISLILLIAYFASGFKGILKNGISIETTPTLWIFIPIFTLIGISLVRLEFGLIHHFELIKSPTYFFFLISSLISAQIFFGLIGYSVMKKVDYFKKYIDGNEKSPVSFALICPGVAFSVLGWFLINFGFVANGIVEKYSIFYFILLLPFIYIQYKTIKTFFILNKKFN